ncbi:MAG: L-serine ammonia-lyase [Mycobacterium sp.]|nr:L-serine ammonia-lyase [Mycobacterium sp.]
MSVSVFDLFSIGIGPSSSHTVGPMRAATRFVGHLAEDGLLAELTRIRVELYGSLGATGAGHGTVGALLLGLEGNRPETLDPAAGRERVEEIRRGRRLLADGARPIAFDVADDIVMSLRTLDFHSNGMVFTATGDDGAVVSRRTYFSVGGGFVVDEDEAAAPPADTVVVPHPFGSAAELVALTAAHSCSIAELMARNERALGREPDPRAALLRIWSRMRECVDAGLSAHGMLPGPLQVRRRAALLAHALDADPDDPLYAMDWVTSTPWRSTRRTPPAAGW